MNISRSDCKALCRYLDSAASAFSSSDKARMVDRARLMRKLSSKLKHKILLEDINVIKNILNEKDLMGRAGSLSKESTQAQEAQVSCS